MQKKNQTLSSNMPRSVQSLYCYCKQDFDNGKKLSIHLDEEVFGDNYELNLHLEDISPLYLLEPISANCMVAYIWHFYKKLVKENNIGKFKFVNPHNIPNFQRTTNDKIGKTERLNQRASFLSDQLIGALVNQLVLVPSSSGFHWNLTVIEPHKEMVYLLDSASQRIRDEEWKYVMEMAIKLFNSNEGKKERKHVQWEVINAPRQTDMKKCSYYVMRYMRQIT
ncbi:uncharacterized protein [Henckelia pumila]|uniref:uncharacterized protein isoform X1 n=1 Tax=Henckelia pumila TaxID=405737 RepID=UPI003C6E6130